jgi:hypothetical protein
MHDRERMKESPMLQITYISTARPELPASAIGEILSASRTNNAAAGVTGLLLYDGYRFLQALEGEPAMVNQTFQRIKADPRHRAVVTLSSRDVSERSFGSWAMAAQRVAISTGTTVAELVDKLTADVSDPTVRETFRSFARVRQAA